jgi:hypothetical protein
MKQVKERAKSKGLDTPFFTHSVSASIAYVTDCFDAGFVASKQFPDKLLTVVFESLLKDPAEQTKRICDFIGVPWNEQMLYPGQKEHIGERAITKNSGEIWYSKKEYYRDPDRQKTEKWLSELSAREQIRTLMAFREREDLKPCGYDFSLNSVTQIRRWQACAYFAWRRLGNGLHRHSAAAVRKIPGIHRFKKGLQAVVAFIG